MKKLVVIFSVLALVGTSLMAGMYLKTAQLAAVQAAPAASTPNVYELWQDTNNERVKAGLQPLVLNTKLMQSANDKCQEMLVDGWGHVDPQGRHGNQLILQYIPTAPTFSENLAEGYYTADQTTAGWMASPPHKAAILSTTYTDVGYATCIAGSNPYVVQHFAQVK